MRTFLFLIGLAVLAVAALIQFRIVSIDQTRAAVVQAPAFNADVARVSVGTEDKTITVPTVDVQKPAPSPAAN